MEEEQPNNKTDPLKESLDILETVDIDLADFAIDSDDDDDNNNNNITETDNEDPSAVMNTSTAAVISHPQSTSSTVPVASTGSIHGSTELKKQTVTANDDPLSALLHSSTSHTNPSSGTTTNSHTSHPVTSSSLPNNAYPPSSTAASAASGNYNVSNVNTVTQSLSSKLSSWSSKFQDAVTSVGATATPASTSTVTAPSSSNTGTHRNHIGTTSYVQRSNSEISSTSYNTTTTNASNASTYQPTNLNNNTVPTVYNGGQPQQTLQQQQQQSQPQQHIYQVGGGVSVGAGPNGINDFDHAMKT